jgi:hypothetical protein
MANRESPWDTIFVEADYKRAYQLVGQYFFEFALLERSFHRGLRYLFGLPSLKSEMLFANMTFRDKVNAFRTAVEFASRVRQDDWVNTALSSLGKILDLSTERNFLAHTSFFPAKDGVSFFKIQAKGKFDVPDVVWTDGEFKEKFERISKFVKEVERIVEDMKSHDTRLKLAELLATPSGERGLLGMLSPHSHPPPGSLLSSNLTSSPQTTPQTPEEPQEKE